MLRPLLSIPPIHFFTHSSSLFLVPPGSSFSFFPPSFYYQLCLSAPLYCRPLSMPLSVSSTLCLLCCFVLSDCIADFGPFLPSYWLLRPVHPTSFSFPLLPSILSFPFLSFVTTHTQTHLPPCMVFYVLWGVVTEHCNTLFSPFALSISFSVPTKFKKKKSSIITVVTNRFSPPTSPLCHMTSHPAGHYGQSTS